jgi:hypothetical protein
MFDDSSDEDDDKNYNIYDDDNSISLNSTIQNKSEINKGF